MDAGSRDLWSSEASVLDDSHVFLAGSTDLMVLASNSTVHRELASRPGTIVFFNIILTDAVAILDESASKLLGVRWFEFSTSRLGNTIGTCRNI
jgi:hypothetical protein